jgi:hypothetical protein
MKEKRQKLLPLKSERKQHVKQQQEQNGPSQQREP